MLIPLAPAPIVTTRTCRVVPRGCSRISYGVLVGPEGGIPSVMLFETRGYVGLLIRGH
jgi:hypothetical protein